MNPVLDLDTAQQCQAVDLMHWVTSPGILPYRLRVPSRTLGKCPSDDDLWSHQILSIHLISNPILISMKVFPSNLWVNSSAALVTLKMNVKTQSFTKALDTIDALFLYTVTYFSQDLVLFRSFSLVCYGLACFASNKTMVGWCSWGSFPTSTILWFYANKTKQNIKTSQTCL